MDAQQLEHGAFSWFELLTSDVAAAKTFYAELFGWQLRDMPMQGMTYSIIQSGGKDVAGLMALPPQAQGAPPHWGVYVTVEDVDATAERVRQLGGEVCAGPQDIPGVGRFCLFRDPQGAMISAITYAMSG